MYVSLVVDTRRNFALAAQLRRKYFGICQFSSRDLVVQHGRHHPCSKTSHFLPCTRPPDVDLLKLRSYFLSQLDPRYVRMVKLPMSSEDTSSLLQDFSPPSSKGCSSGGHFLFPPLLVFSLSYCPYSCEHFLLWVLYSSLSL
jgi:hypothetical protein